MNMKVYYNIAVHQERNEYASDAPHGVINKHANHKDYPDNKAKCEHGNETRE